VHIYVETGLHQTKTKIMLVKLYTCRQIHFTSENAVYFSSFACRCVCLSVTYASRSLRIRTPQKFIIYREFTPYNSRKVLMKSKGQRSRSRSLGTKMQNCLSRISFWKVDRSIYIKRTQKNIHFNSANKRIIFAESAFWKSIFFHTETRSQAVARIADRTAKNCRGHVT